MRDVDRSRVFPPDSMIWKICRERAVLLHGPAAAVLQIAHPRVGLGVLQHSQFTESPFGRLIRTLNTVYAIAFGTKRQAKAAARRVARRHAKVKGDAQAHDVPGQPNYSVGEPELLMWVVATLVWSAVGGFERTVHQLTLTEKQRFYDDMRVLGTFFGLPTSVGPQTWPDFLAYFETQLHDPMLGSHPISQRVARDVARPPKPRILWLATAPIAFLYSEILPAPVRERLGFRSTWWSRFSYAAATLAFRALVRFGPSPLRFVAEYRAARHCHPENGEGSRAARALRDPSLRSG